MLHGSVSVFLLRVRVLPEDVFPRKASLPVCVFCKLKEMLTRTVEMIRPESDERPFYILERKRHAQCAVNIWAPNVICPLNVQCPAVSKLHSCSQFPLWAGANLRKLEKKGNRGSGKEGCVSSPAFPACCCVLAFPAVFKLRFYIRIASKTANLFVFFC